MLEKMLFDDHITNANPTVCLYLSGLLNVYLSHGKIPQQCMRTVIEPIFINKKGDISDAGNCRPVSLTIISNIFDHYISYCISPFVAPAENQIGFKQIC